MTPQDWKEVEENLKYFYTTVKLKCDGYNITLRLERISQFENGILIYVNGKMDFKWIGEDCEERRRFMQPVKKSLFSQKQKASLKKISKRLRQKSGLPEPNVSYTCYRPYWKSFRSLKSHLVKNNNSIELIKEQKDGE